MYQPACSWIKLDLVSALQISTQQPYSLYNVYYETIYLFHEKIASISRSKISALFPQYARLTSTTLMIFLSDLNSQPTISWVRIPYIFIDNCRLGICVVA